MGSICPCRHFYGSLSTATTFRSLYRLRSHRARRFDYVFDSWGFERSSLCRSRISGRAPSEKIRATALDSIINPLSQLLESRAIGQGNPTRSHPCPVGRGSVHFPSGVRCRHRRLPPNTLCLGEHPPRPIDVAKRFNPRQFRLGLTLAST
jgi:hypothetical protein